VEAKDAVGNASSVLPTGETFRRGRFGSIFSTFRHNPPVVMVHSALGHPSQIRQRPSRIVLRSLSRFNIIDGAT